MKWKSWIPYVLLLIAAILIEQFGHPSPTGTIVVLFIILTWILSNLERQRNDRLDRIETELSKKTAAPQAEPLDDADGRFEGMVGKERDAVLETITELREYLEGKSEGAEDDRKGRLDDAENDLKWRLDNLKIDLQNLEKPLGHKIESSSNDAREKLAEISNRLTALELSFTKEDRQSAISWQIECARRLQQISEGASELRKSVATAKLRSEDESSRSVTINLLGCAQQEAESIILPGFKERHLSVLSMQLEKVQRIVREATLASPALSLEQIESETRSILHELDGIEEWAKAIEDEGVAKITSFSPPTGPVGTSVVITGQGLGHTSKVRFGGVVATTFTVNSDTQVTASVPRDAKTGRIAVTTAGVTAVEDQVAVSSETFTVNPQIPLSESGGRKKDEKN